MPHLEIEVKFFLPQLDPVRDRLLQMGAVSMGRHREYNLRYEDQHQSLLRRKALLRLRRDSRAHLTFKAPPAVPDDQFKVLQELEVQISDFDTMDAILQALGYHREQVYEKWRETLTLKQLKCCLDTMPFGNFLELEGSRDRIQSVAEKLALEWPERILQNYLEIFTRLKNEYNLPFNDVTFANFGNHPVDPAACLQQLNR